MHFIIKQISRLPFGVLYVISDVVCFFLYRLIGYRKKIVRKNLRSSFPEKSDEELKEIERKFYHWLCDYFVETIKLLSMTPEEMKEHMEFHNVHLATEAYDRGQGFSAFLGHYCNWEWLSAVGIYYPKGYENVFNGLIYHPLRNDFMDNLMKEARSNLRGTPVPKKNILREIVRLKKEGTPYLFGYIFDQSPKWENIHLYWGRATDEKSQRPCGVCLYEASEEREIYCFFPSHLRQSCCRTRVCSHKASSRNA